MLENAFAWLKTFEKLYKKYVFHHAHERLESLFLGVLKEDDFLFHKIIFLKFLFSLYFFFVVG